MRSVLNPRSQCQSDQSDDQCVCALKLEYLESLGAARRLNRSCREISVYAGGDSKRRWLVDSGVTCHIIFASMKSCPEGVGENVFPTRGMVMQTSDLQSAETCLPPVYAKRKNSKH